MASLNSIAELVYRQINPNFGDENGNLLAEYIASANLLYATQLWKINRDDNYREGQNSLPSNLLTPVTLEIVNNEVDLTDVPAFFSMPNNSWLQSLGGFECGICEYDIMDLNKYKLLCNDDSMVNSKPAVIVGKKIKFPKGTYGKKDEIELIYAGSSVNSDFEIDDVIGGMIRVSLFELYSKKFMEDKTNNSNPNV